MKEKVIKKTSSEINIEYWTKCKTDDPNVEYVFELIALHSYEVINQNK